MRGFLPGVLVLLLAGSGGHDVVAARKPKPVPCPPGRFLVPETFGPLLPADPGAAGAGAVVFDGARVGIDGACPLAKARIRTTRRATHVVARWDACGERRKVRLVARIEQPGCAALRGTLRARKLRARSFTATRSSCGDGVVDAAGSESCEPGVVACDAGAFCTEGCECVPEGSETTTTTTVTSTSTSTTLAPPPSTTTPTTSSTSTSSSTTTTATTSPSSSTTTIPTDPPPDPATVAPPRDPATSTDFASATAFLYAGPTPVQFGVAPGAIAPVRAAVVRGRVLARDGSPLPAVAVSILGHPELGGTLSRADGRYDLAVAGGGPLTVVLAKDGLLSAQRRADVPWQDFVNLPDVVLLPLDSAVTTIDLANPGAPVAVARGTVQTDAHGSRQATLLVPQGAAAEAVLPDGSVRPLPAISVRATEYTVGDAGPAAMPGGLPPSSGYTYALELSVDEAAADGTTVRFDRALPFYVENFLGFPVGMAVPAGYFDRRLGVWVASENGRVIGVAGVTGQVADVDVDGDGVADTGAALDALGIGDAERAELARLYAPGTTLWRVPIRHFTPWDCNWPYGPPDDAEAPDVADPTSDPAPDEQCLGAGSVIQCEKQVLGETIGLAGTPFALHYRSDRVPGRRAGRTLAIPVSGAALPASLLGIRVRVEVAGQRHEQTFAPLPNQRTTFTWDGLDAYGRPVQGGQVARGAVEYLYRAVYRTPSQLEAAFAQFGGALSAVEARQEIVLARPFTVPVNAADARGIGLGGWTLDVHHTYDPTTGILREGNGRRRRAEALGRVIDRVELGGFVMDGNAFAIGPDGSIYFATDQPGQQPVVRRRLPDGTVVPVAGSPTATQLPRPYGDGGPALAARLLIPIQLAVGPDGSLYIVDVNVVRRVGPDGIITTVAGRRNDGPSGGEGCENPPAPDGSPATESGMCPQTGIAIGPDGALYIAQVGGDRPVRRVGPDGIITTVIGQSTRCNRFFDPASCGDGGPASAARIQGVNGLAFGPDGSLYLADGNVIRRIRPDGVVERVAGALQGNNGFTGDGGPATSARLAGPRGLVVAPDGTITFVDSSNERVRVIDPSGIIRTIAGTGQTCFSGEDCASGDGGPSIQARLRNPNNMLAGPDGGLYLVNALPRRIRRIGTALPAFAATDIFLPSEDGRGLYVFDQNGRHLRTHSTLTGATLLIFAYDAAGRLAQVAQATGGAPDLTTIERDGAGNPTGIVGPYGHRTALTIDANGFLASITDPSGAVVGLGSTADGLLTSLVDPRAESGNQKAHTTAFDYDADGRLVADTDPLGHSQTLERDEVEGGFEVTRTESLALATRSRVETMPTGIERRTVTTPDGTSARSDRSVDGGRVTVTTADGAVLTHVAAPDPRFDMAAPITATRTLRLPGGLEHTLSATRAVTLTDPDDPTSLVSLVDQVKGAGGTTTIAYDAATRVLTTTSPAGRTGTVTLDALGRPVRLDAPGRAPAFVSYDARGRLASIAAGEDAAARTLAFGYDAAGHLVTATDPLGRTVTYTHDAAGRLAGTTLADGRAVSFGYDAAGHLTSLAPPGRPAHGFAWDARGELAAYTPPAAPGSGPTTWGLDAARRLASVTRPGDETLALAYDAGGRLTSQTLARGGVPVAAYTRTYDASGRLATVIAPQGVALALAYDGPFVTGRTWSGPVAGTVTHAYDTALRPASESVAGSDTVAFGHDPDGFLLTAGALVITRDPESGLPTGATLGVVGDAWTYDPFGPTATYEARANGDAIYAATYVRDLLGRIVTKSETVAGTTREYAYAYDAADRLVEVRRDGAVVEEYGYDANGNRLTSDAAGPEVAATYDAQDRLVTRGGATFAYDGAGRLTSRTQGGATTTYAWDAFGQLAGAALPDGRAIAYLADGEGRRVGKRIDGVLVQGFLYADELRPVAQVDAAGTVVARFVYAGGTVPAYVVRGGVAYRLVTDAAGSVRLVVNAGDGTVVQRLDYDAFGNVVGDTNPGFQPFAFGGGLYDPDTGFVRFGVRDYDPATGRWTAPDPIRFAGGDTNLYAYAGNDPVNRGDPTGLFDWTSFLAGVGYGAVQAIGGLADMLVPGVTNAIDQIVDGVRSIVELVNGVTMEGDTFDLVLDALDLETLVDRGSPEFIGGQVCGVLAASAATGGGGGVRGAAAGAERGLTQAVAGAIGRGPRQGLVVHSVRDAELGIARAVSNESFALEQAAARQVGRAADEGGLELVRGAQQGGNLQRPVRPLGAGRGR